MWNLKKKKMNLLQNRKRLTDLENRLVVARGLQGREGLGVWD